MIPKVREGISPTFTLFHYIDPPLARGSPIMVVVIIMLGSLDGMIGGQMIDVEIF